METGRDRIGDPVIGEKVGDVGEKVGDVGEYDGDVGEYDGDGERDMACAVAWLCVGSSGEFGSE